MHDLPDDAAGDVHGADAISSSAMPSFLDDLPVSRRAFALAARRHAGQTRPLDGAPFLLHPLKVANLLHAAGERDETVAAALLHDLLEDTKARREEIVEAAGEPVAALVDVLTEDPSVADFAARKDEVRGRVARGPRAAVAVFAADKLAKARELRHLHALGDPTTERRLDHYRHSRPIVEERLGADHPLTVQLRFELEALSGPFAPARAHRRR